MIAAALLVLLQVAPDTPQRFSVLTPECPTDMRTDREIVVCANTAGSRLPLPDERPPVGPLPLNPALMVDPSPRPAGGAPCAARLGGCQVGFGPPLAPIVNAASGLMRNVTARRPDRTGRVSIPLDDTPLPALSTPMSPAKD